MRTMRSCDLSILFRIFIFVVCLNAVSIVSAQGPERIKPPNRETFRDVAPGLIIPRAVRQETCGVLTPNPEPDCTEIISVQEKEKFSIVSIYNLDESIWLNLRIWPSRDPRYFEGLNEDFSPVFPNSEFKIQKGKLYSLIVMRVVRESQNWYEVEVNEKTRKTKFILKTDPMWARADWYDLFNMSYHVYIDPNKTKVLKTPNGEPRDCGMDNPSRHVFSRLEGEWMLVNKGVKECEGWLQWRSGRQMLVGSRLTDWKIPKFNDVQKQ